MIEERLQQIMKNHETADLRQRISPKQTGGFVPPTRHSEQWTVDPYWDMDRPTPVQHDRPGQTRSKERPIREDGTRSKNNRRRTKRLGFGTSSARNGEKIFYRSTAAYDRDDERRQPTENTSMSGKTAT